MIYMIDLSPLSIPENTDKDFKTMNKQQLQQKISELGYQLYTFTDLERQELLKTAMTENNRGKLERVYKDAMRLKADREKRE